MPLGKAGLKTAVFLSTILGCLAYIPTVSFQFLWDDTHFILQNNFLRNPLHLFTVFYHFFSQDVMPVAGGARPLWVASLVWDYGLWGLNPAGYHLTNVLLHAANCGLAALLVYRTLGGSRTALAVGAGFALHPAHVETVAAIGFRTDLLCLLFVQISCLLFFHSESLLTRSSSARSARGMGIVTYAGSVLSYGMALLAKEMAAPLLAVLFVRDLLARPVRPLWKRSFVYVPFLLVLVLYGFQHHRRFIYNLEESVSAMVSSGQRMTEGLLARADLTTPVWAKAETPARRPDSPAAETGRVFHNPTTNIATMSTIFSRYVFKMIWPFHLCADYDLRVETSLGRLPVVLSLAVMGGGLWLIWRVRESAPHLSWGLAWFALFLAPVSNVIPIANLFAERYLYIPSLGFLLAAAAGGRWFVNRWKPGAGTGTRMTQGLFAVLTSLFLVWTVKTMTYSQVWRDDLRLFTATVHCAPGNFRPWYNAGLSFQRRRQWEKAVSFYRQAAQRGPHRKEIYVNMGRCYERLDDLNAAETVYLHALRLDPTDAVALINLGNVYLRRREPERAIEHYQQALQVKPDYDPALLNLANVYGQQKRWVEAGAAYEQALRRHPHDKRILSSLAEIKKQMNRLP